MKAQISAFALVGLLIGGCYFPNQCGLSPFYYDEKYSFYDSQGVYREVCPSSNVFNYEDMRPRYGQHNPYVYDELMTPVPADSPRGIQALQNAQDEWEEKQAELAQTQGMAGGRNSAYPRGYRQESMFDSFLGF